MWKFVCVPLVSVLGRFECNITVYLTVRPHLQRFSTTCGFRFAYQDDRPGQLDLWGLSRVHIRSWLWSNYNQIKFGMGSHQLITVPDCNIIAFNNLKRVVWSNNMAWLKKMADMWWHEETKLLIALWSEEAVQKQVKYYAQCMGQNKPRNG